MSKEIEKEPLNTKEVLYRNQLKKNPTNTSPKKVNENTDFSDSWREEIGFSKTGKHFEGGCECDTTAEYIRIYEAEQEEKKRMGFLENQENVRDEKKIESTEEFFEQ